MLQLRPASRSASACPSISAAIAADVRRVALTFPLPCLCSTACACASRLRHTSGSLGSTGSLPASRSSASRGQLLECPTPAREAPQQLPGRVGYTRAGLKALALERAMVRLGEPTATSRGSPFRITDRGRQAGRERCPSFNSPFQIVRSSATAADAMSSRPTLRRERTPPASPSRRRTALSVPSPDPAPARVTSATCSGLVTDPSTRHASIRRRNLRIDRWRDLCH